MNLVKRHTPEGVQDVLPLECHNKRLHEALLLREFTLSGYIAVETPSFEFYETFTEGIGSASQEQMIKFFDQNGRILVLRPDLTMPIARLCAVRLYDGAPLRLCYVGNAFGADSAYYGTQKEFTQAGVELFGQSGPEADAEVIALAISALKAVGLRDFKIDMGQVEYFKGLMEEAGLTDSLAEELRESLDKKDHLTAEVFLRRSGIGPGAAGRIAALTGLYGGAEIFAQARRVSRHPRCLAAVENLRQVYSILCTFGLEPYLSIDFGLLQSLDYYSGITFKGISAQLGSPLLSGGRYDALAGEFGRTIPATGFALGVKRLLIALEKQGSLLPLPGVANVLSGDSDALRAVFDLRERLIRQGEITLLALQLAREPLCAYAKTLGAAAYYCQSDGEVSVWR